MSKRPFWTCGGSCARPPRPRSSRAPSRPGLTMSPMPRMRPAMRSAWNSSSASSFSPVPTKRIGLPVTARIDSAAPPRPSPSMRVSTTPVSRRRRREARATFTASCPVSASADQQRSRAGRARSRTSATSAISASSMCSGPAVSSSTDVVAAERGLLPCALRDLRPASGRARSAAVSTPDLLAQTRSCSIAAGRRGYRARPSAPACPRARPGGLAILAVVVVLPEPCRPTIRIGAGGLSMRQAGPAPPSPASTRDQLVMDDLDHLLARA
ncbi:MAG: hypothetical protein KatS3mg118_1656 [Paracoccaceae bacterium]|nr:MAG: hypothetical protein KatS3mg118_1656 [Paracoccaceae bacterium]